MEDKLVKRMMRRTSLLGFLYFVVSIQAFAQKSVLEGIPYTKREQQLELNKQAYALFNSAKPAVAETGKSTVFIYSGKRRLGLGTIFSNKRIVSKASELTTKFGPLLAVDYLGREITLIDTKVSSEHDLAIFTYDSEELQSIDLAKYTEAEAGKLVFLSSPGDEVLGMGVVSVMPRSLRSVDRGFLGIAMDGMYDGKGVRVRGVERESAAEKSGLQPGDVLKKINGRELDGLTETRTILQRLIPGDKIEIEYIRSNQSFKGEAVLGSYPYGKDRDSDRTKFMQKMGTRLNQVRDEFPNVIQTDMQIEPEDCGAPVVNLNGEFVGIAISRSSRIKTFVIPAKVIQSLLEPEKYNEQEDFISSNYNSETESDESLVRSEKLPLSQLLSKVENLTKEELNPEDKEKVSRQLNEIQKLLDGIKKLADE